MTVRRALNDYLREHVAVKVADTERQQTASDHLTAFFGETPLKDIDILASRQYAAARRAGQIGGGRRRKDKTGGDTTIRRELNVLTAAWNHARRWRRIDIAPALELPADERANRDEELPYFDKMTLQRMFGSCEGELRAWLRITYYTAARRASIEDLTAEQVKLFHRTITLATPGKRRTKKRQPIVPIFDEIVKDVAWLLDRHPTGRLFETSSFYRPFMLLCRSMDLPEPHHPHMLRHSRATHLLQDGKDIYDVAKLLGDTVATVERTYGHHSPATLLGKLQ